MKKIFSLFAAVLMAGSMMAQRVTLDFSNAATVWGFPTDYVNANASYSNGTYTIGMVKGTAGSGWKALEGAIIYGKTNAALTLPAFDFAVSKIEVVGASGASASTVFNIFVGENAVSTAVTGATGTASFLINAASQAAGTVYSIKITSSHNNQISAIKIYEAVAGAPEVPTFSVAEGVYTAAQTVTLACATDGAEIRYTLDGTEPTATSTLYTAALTISETTTVKAVAVKNGVASVVASATYTIIYLDGEGTQANPYTIADVKKLNNPGTTGVWVAGTIVGFYANNKLVVGTEGAAATNLAIATGNDTIPVGLATGAARTALNLVDHPENLDKTVKVKGDLQAYFSTTGVKNVNDYELETASTINYWLVGPAAENGWDQTKAMPMPGDSIVRHLNAGTYEFKVLTQEGSWTGALGFANLNAEASSANVFGDDNVCFELENEGDVTIKVVEGQIVVLGTFKEQVAYDYYIKFAGNNWTWVGMTQAPSGVYMYEGVWGGTGANVNTQNNNNGAVWYPEADIFFGTEEMEELPVPAVGTVGYYVYIPDAEPAPVLAFLYEGTPTAVENVEAAKAVKVIENGQVVIIREGVRYNAVGAKL